MNFKLVSRTFKTLVFTCLFLLTFNATVLAAPYRITIKTCDVAFAGTDSNVSFTSLIGDNNSPYNNTFTPVVLNKDGYNDFEQNDFDSYDVDYEDVGNIKSILISKDGTDDWCLERVGIKNLNSNEIWLSDQKQTWFKTVIALDANTLKSNPSNSINVKKVNSSILIDVATRKCLDSNTKGIYTGNCNFGDYQLWKNIGSNDQIIYQNVATGLCLDSNTKGDSYINTCNTSNYQKWKNIGSGDKISYQNIATGLCLDTNNRGSVYTMSCNSGDYQKWRYPDTTPEYDVNNDAMIGR